MRFVSRLIAVLLLFTSLLASSALAAPTVATERPLYIKQGDVIPIEGDAAPSVNVTVQITASNGDTFIQVFKVPVDGHYSYNYTMSGGPEVYRLTVEVNGIPVKTYSVVVTKTEVADTVAGMIQSTSTTLEGLKVYVAELEAQGIHVAEEAAVGMTQAQGMLTEATQLLEEGDAHGAWSSVKEAQETIRQVFKSAHLPETPPVEEPADSVMRQALQRALEYHNKLNGTARTLEGRGVDPSNIRLILRQARVLLREAEESYVERDSLRFEAAIREAAQMMNETNSMIRGEMSHVKLALAARYKEGMQSRVINVRQLLSTYKSQVSPIESSRVSADLSLTEEKLARLQEALTANRLDLGALRDLSDDIRAALRNISDEEVRRLLEEMSSIRARIEEASQSGATNGSTYQSRIQYESQRLQRIREYLRRLYEASRGGD